MLNNNIKILLLSLFFVSNSFCANNKKNPLVTGGKKSCTCHVACSLSNNIVDIEDLFKRVKHPDLALIDAMGQGSVPLDCGTIRPEDMTREAMIAISRAEAFMSDYRRDDFNS